MEWRKGTLLEALNNTIYDDKLGFYRLSVRSVHIYNEVAYEWRTLNDFFIKEKGVYVNLNCFNEYRDAIFLIEHLFDLKLFTLNAEKAQQMKYYSSQYHPKMIDLEKVKHLKILIDLCSTSEKNDRFFGRKSFHNEFSIIYDSAEKLAEKVYLISEQKEILQIEPNLKDIKIGDKYYCKYHNCTCEITQLYDYPNKEGLLFDVKLLLHETPIDEDNFTVTEANKSEKQIFILPYLEKGKPLNRFNESLDELILQPCVMRDNNSKTFNVFWQPIETASRYIVSLYKTVELSYKEKIYHLKDYEVDRIDNFISIDGLVGDNFVFVIKAEDRTGKEIAKSRGISIGEPKFW